MTLTSLGKHPTEQVARRMVARDAAPGEVKAAALETAGELLAPLVRAR